jgi:methylthioribose-1-phosphate isomerase
MNFQETLSPLRYRDGVLWLLDQRALPAEENWVAHRDYRAVVQAIVDLVVRGAPAIGCAAAYAVAIAARQGAPFTEAVAALKATRPTAVNLFWALERMSRVSPRSAEHLEREAIAIHEEDVAACVAIGGHGAALLPEGVVLTHCNAGALATGGYGTALGVIRAAVASGRDLRVYADETRPVLQGARLTIWELLKSGIDTTLITDNMAAHLIAKGEIQSVIVGADRIAENGDTANKIGTYGLALAAREHRIPFFVAAPRSTIDRTISDGSHIAIEERSPREITYLGDRRLAPEGVKVRNPAFDVTPAHLVTALITEVGVASPPKVDSIRRLFE